MDLSIIIPSFNTKDLLDRCLASIYESLKGKPLGFEIIVVDNGSADGTKEILNTKYERVVKIFNKENLGFGKSNNIGIQKAKGEYILLLNSDTKAIDNAIEKLLTFAKDHPRAFIGGKLLNEDGSPQSSCGPMYTLPMVFAMLFLKADALRITRYSPDSEKVVDWVSGACLAGLRKDFLKLGLFDAKIFMYMEEIDFLYRAKRTGHTVLFYPAAVFIHTGAASSGNRKRPVVNIYQGLQFFYRKHMTGLDQTILKIMLIVKAYAAIVVARLIGQKDTVSIYEEALRVLK